MDMLAHAEHLLPVIQKAGDQARAIQHNPQTSIKSDGTPVTQADRIANDIIVDYLSSNFPGDAILSEEIADDKQRLRNERTWIIDPIDGTSAFVKGRDDWAVQIALSVNNKLQLGMLYLPNINRYYFGIPGHGAWIIDQNQRNICSVPRQPDNILLCSRSKRNAESMDKAKIILSEFSSLSVSSVGVKVDRMIQGLGSVYVNPSAIHEWDYAAPAAVLIAAGGFATDFDAQPLPVNSDESICSGIIFSSLRHHNSIVERLKGLRS